MPLFEDSSDDDDRNGLGVQDDPEFGSTAYEAGDYWEFRGRVSHWTPAVLGEQYDSGELEMRDVVVRAEATIDQGDGVVGVSCRETPDSDAEWQWYELVARDGFAAIRHADLESNIKVLAETEDVELPGDEPFVGEASCVDDADGDVQLALALNGAPVLQAAVANPIGQRRPVPAGLDTPVARAEGHPLARVLDTRTPRT